MNEIRTEENLEKVDITRETVAEKCESPVSQETQIPAEELVFVQDASDYGI